MSIDQPEIVAVRPIHLRTLRRVLPFSLALFVSSGAVMVLAHGIGAGSIFNGCFLVTVTLALFFSGDFADLSFGVSDLTFLIFAAAIAASFAKNGVRDMKEVALLLVTLSGYPAGRVMAGDPDLRPYIVATSAVVSIGVIATAIALPAFVNARPMVFGVESAPQFTIAFAFLLFGLVSKGLTWPRVRMIAPAAAIASAVFAAALVRFSLFAILVTLGAMVWLVGRRERKMLGCIIAAVIGGIALGVMSRADHLAIRFLEQPLAVAQETLSSAPPSSPAMPCEVQEGNSVAIRKQLLIDAVAAVPTAGMFGIGLDNFRGCIPSSPHNDVLQAVVEFGWIGGAAWVALVVVSLTARGSPLILSGLIFSLLMSVAHGRISREWVLFFFLGAAARLKEGANVGLGCGPRDRLVRAGLLVREPQRLFQRRK